MTRRMIYGMTRAHATRLIALGLCTAALSSCSVPGSELGLTAGEPRAVVGAHSLHDDDALMTAEATGELTLSAGECLELRAADSPPILLIFPTEAHMLPGGWPGLQIHDEEFRVGEQLSISGGYLQLSDADTEAVAQCQSTGEAFVVQTLAQHPKNSETLSK